MADSKPGGKPLFTVVIPVLNSPGLELAVRSIQEQTRRDLVDSIVVVGQQPSGPWCDLPGVIYLPNDQPTPARNRNLGASYAKTEWLVFLDSDCAASAGWLEAYAEAIRAGSQVMAGSVAIEAGTPYWGRCFHYFGFEHQVSENRRPGKIPLFASLNFCINRLLFVRFAGFREDFDKAAGEDMDLSVRISKAHLDTRYIPAARVLHYHGRHHFPEVEIASREYGIETVRVWRGNKPAGIRKVGLSLARLPVIGEVGLIMRVVYRAFLRGLRQPYLLLHPSLFPGMLRLDYAHSVGILIGLRS